MSLNFVSMGAGYMLFGIPATKMASRARAKGRQLAVADMPVIFDLALKDK
jgi:hypothetical protein